MKNYIDYFKPGGTIKVKNIDGTDYGSEIQSTNLHNLYEYIKLAVDKIKQYNELDLKLKEINPNYNKNTPVVPKWNILDYFNSASDPRYKSLRGQFRNINDNNSSNSI